MRDEFRRRAVTSEDAFDAAVSALVMSAAAEELLRLPPEPDYLVEGKIWWPSAPVGRSCRGSDRGVRLTSDGHIQSFVFQRWETRTGPVAGGCTPAAAK
jgi:hypothetical protein